MKRQAPKKSVIYSGLLVAMTGVLALAILPTTACSNQAEGERCDHLSDNGGNDDCDDGLVCTPAGTLGTSSDICCPQDRSQATTDVCKGQSGSVGADAAPPADSSTDTGTTTTDSGTDSATDSATDSGAAEAGDATTD